MHGASIKFYQMEELVLRPIKSGFETGTISFVRGKAIYLNAAAGKLLELSLHSKIGFSHDDKGRTYLSVGGASQFEVMRKASMLYLNHKGFPWRIFDFPKTGTAKYSISKTEHGGLYRIDGLYVKSEYVE